MGIHVEVYLFRQATHCELFAIDLETGEQWTVKGDDPYEAACLLAEMVGVELEE